MEPTCVLGEGTQALDGLLAVCHRGEINREPGGTIFVC